ncbi:MAG: glutamate-5-semialdehyde dehydrogenase [Eubacteriales bacterium]|nr:glutamate-5-semialdehyde dehydrogenase [Eubacteriales bacterium]MDD3196737.1 glutamate-5-semialdehyde dehydrogenase [Eubacteriales bacterium]MDD3503778.1 glutamate-5-semialdehyde dehydrogenase [Eubacteriales bacterium]MDD4681993.1 glutamate-5-semialdehyde dehydrogenase [Eubacteriales bacterium]
MNTYEAAAAAQRAARVMAGMSSETKNKALRIIADMLKNNSELIISANQSDLERSQSEKLAAPLMKRLKFDQHKLEEVTDGLNSLIGLDDPAGKTLLMHELDDGLDLYRVSCPIGVIGVIFESRPDALVQIAGLCLKSGNALLLKGGSEARKTNRVLADLIIRAGEEAGLPAGWVWLMETREDVNAMLALDQFVDLLIPRGSNEFVRYIMDHSRIPVLGHADGVCHMFIDETADSDMAIKLAVDSKTQYTAVCNALETLLVHSSQSGTLLPLLAENLRQSDVEIFGCEKTCELLGCQPVSDWHTEYLDLKISLRIVDNIEQAIEHINTYGSGHTEAIVTSDSEAAKRFMLLVDAGNVFWNCSTRFSDGFRYGFGAEVGVSTSKLHARGPVGLDGLMTYKYKLIGRGQTVGEYANGSLSFKHKVHDRNCPL